MTGCQTLLKKWLVMKERRMNFVIVMADQLAAQTVGAYGHPVVRTPNMDALAAAGVVFDNAYCPSPLCAPSRASMMTGQMPSRIGAYDNAAELPASVPTFAHYLRRMGYQTCLSGKMHFVGPDQLHGFEERLTTDIYPADFGWTPDWEAPEQRVDWWCHNILSVKQAGIAEITNQLEYDDEVGHQAIRKIYDLARRRDPRPFLLMASFTHPHDPYASRREHWERYDHAAIDAPRVPAIPYADMDPHSRRLHDLCALGEYPVSDEDVRNARHAYYGNVSYFDDWVGRIVATLDATGLRDDTTIMVLSDHGDMLGERGLWYKMSFFEASARVPLVVTAPARFAPRRIANAVSLVDLLPTLVDLAADGPHDFADAMDGRTLVPLLEGKADADADEAFAEILCEGAVAPCLMIRRGRYKYIHCDADPAQLFDLVHDPDERRNLAAEPDFAEIASRFDIEARVRWDIGALHARILADQKRRRMVFDALAQGHHTPWDHQPVEDASRRFMRNNLDLNELESTSRFPPPKSP